MPIHIEGKIALTHKKLFKLLKILDKYKEKEQPKGKYILFYNISDDGDEKKWQRKKG